MFAFKLNGARLRYEIAISIDTADIVWVPGPYACRSFPEVKIFKEIAKTVPKVMNG